MPVCLSLQVPCAQLSALAVVLEHGRLAADPALLCSAARVCKGWQAVVAASAAGTTAVVLNNHLKTPQRQAHEYANSLLEKSAASARGFQNMLQQCAASLCRVQQVDHG